VLDIHDVLPEFYASKFHVAHDSFMSVAWSLRNGGQLPSPITLLWPITCGASGSPIVAECHRSVHPFATIQRAVSSNPNIRSRGNGKFLITYPGSLNWHQGVDGRHQRRFAKIKDQMPDAEFHIYGEN